MVTCCEVFESICLASSERCLELSEDVNLGEHEDLTSERMYAWIALSRFRMVALGPMQASLRFGGP